MKRLIVPRQTDEKSAGSLKLEWNSWGEGERPAIKRILAPEIAAPSRQSSHCKALSLSMAFVPIFGHGDELLFHPLVSPKMYLLGGDEGDERMSWDILVNFLQNRSQ